MKIEIRADGTHISGYVNVTGKKSKPIRKPNGIKCIEEIEERAFEDAIQRAGNITVTVDHDDTHIYASTEKGSLIIKEDAIGLHADVLIDDPEIINLARKGKIKGWSFGMYNVIDSMEDRAEGLPIRHIKKLDLDHLTLVVNKQPCYAATSVEIRADNESQMEFRSSDIDIELVVETPKETLDYTNYKKRIEALNLAN